jgi:hypothetical protein
MRRMKSNISRFGMRCDKRRLEIGNFNTWRKYDHFFVKKKKTTHSLKNLSGWAHKGETSEKNRVTNQGDW